VRIAVAVNGAAVWNVKAYSTHSSDCMALYPDRQMNSSTVIKKLNSVALVPKRTIPTERPPLSAK
jgi:hypothetical protein